MQITYKSPISGMTAIETVTDDRIIIDESGILFAYNANTYCKVLSISYNQTVPTWEQVTDNGRFSCE